MPGALFVGGQEHRYDQPLDPLPDRHLFFVEISDNVFIGNSNPSRNSGAMRFTMESRGVFKNNIVVQNSGIYFQRSEAVIENNVILDNMLLIETKQGLAPCRVRNNLIWADFALETEAEVTDNNLKTKFAGNASRLPAFIDDGIPIRAISAVYNPGRFTTSILMPAGAFKPNELVHRIAESGSRFGVVKSNDAKSVEVWGDLSGGFEFAILPTYRVK